MKTNDLRIGNLVEYYIDTDNLGWQPTNIDWQDLKRLSEQPESFNLEHRFIQITDEWFISCQSNSLFNNGFTNRKTNTGRYDIFCGSVFITVIEFVHELQNLNFALLGEELIFNKEYL